MNERMGRIRRRSKVTRPVHSSISSSVSPTPSPPQLLAMPRSPTSSEDEMARSFSDDSSGAASDTSREETIYETIRATAEPPRPRTDDVLADSLVVRVLVPDLQQTVSNHRDLGLLSGATWNACAS